MCKMIISVGLFFRFFKIVFLGFWRGKRAKNCRKWQKFCLSFSISQELFILWLPFMVCMCKMIISPGFFFHFFKILILRVVEGTKVQKITQNDKKFCLSHVISQEPFIIWSSFMVDMCKKIISPGAFFSLKKC